MSRQYPTRIRVDGASASGRRYGSVLAGGTSIRARAKLSALRSRGKCVAGYSPPTACNGHDCLA